MKRLILPLMVLLTLSLSSCSVCTVCQIKAGDFYSSVPDEFCGTPAEVEEFEKDYAKRAENLGIENARAYCNRK
jgi:hypothetical protein